MYVKTNTETSDEPDSDNEEEIFMSLFTKNKHRSLKAA